MMFSAFCGSDSSALVFLLIIRRQVSETGMNCTLYKACFEPCYTRVGMKIIVTHTVVAFMGNVKDMMSIHYNA